MTTTQSLSADTSQPVLPSTSDFKIEVVALPVEDVGRTKRFYEGLGWRVDADFSSGDDWHLVQMTPPGSPTSVMFGKGFTSAAPGSVHGTFLVVDDLEAARADLQARGAQVSATFHFQDRKLTLGEGGRVSGPDPEHQSYFSFATFSDPDGNGWLLQEVTTRFPGRGFSSDAQSMIALLREAEQQHGAYERVSAKHHWSLWYAAYVVARQRGESMEAAAAGASRFVDQSEQRSEA